MSIDPQKIKEIAILASIKKLRQDLENLPKDFKGEKGDKGDKGDRGERGLDGKNGLDGRDGRDGRDGSDGRDGVDGRDGAKGEDGNIKDLSPEEIRDALELLIGDDRLDASAIKGLEEHLKTIKEIRTYGGQKAVYLYIDGVKKGLLNTFDLVGGTNVDLTHTKVNGLDTITVDATGGVSTWADLTGKPTWVVETPTGTVDGSNKDFVMTYTPVSNAVFFGFTSATNSMMLALNTHFTISSKTITTTLAYPTGSGTPFVQYQTTDTVVSDYEDFLFQDGTNFLFQDDTQYEFNTPA